MLDQAQARENLLFFIFLCSLVFGGTGLLVVLVTRYVAKEKKKMNMEYRRYAEHKGYQYQESYNPAQISQCSLMQISGFATSLSNAISGSINNVPFHTFIFDYGLRFALGARGSGFSARLIVFTVGQNFNHVVIYGGSYRTKNNGFNFKTIGPELIVDENTTRLRVFCPTEVHSQVKQYITPELLKQLSTVQGIDTIELFNNHIIIATATSQLNRALFEYKAIDAQNKDYSVNLDKILSSSASAASLIESAIYKQNSEM